MSKDREQTVFAESLQERFKHFSRVERVFYAALLLTALMMAISAVYLQGRSQQLEQEISAIKRQIREQETDFSNAKQEVNELSRLERITQIVGEVGIQPQQGSLEKVD